MHVHLADGFDTLQGHVGQHVCLDATQEHVVFHLIDGILFRVLEFVLLVIHDTNAKDQLVGVVVVEDAIQVVAEAGIDFLGNLFHGQLLVCHTLAIQLDTEQPGRYASGIEIGHFVVDIDELLIFGYDCALRIGIVVNGCVRSDLTQSCVFQAAENVFGFFCVTRSAAS